MIFPIGDSPNPRGYTPWVNYGLIAVNVAVFLLLLPLSYQRVDPSDPAVYEYVEALSRDGRIGRAELRAVLSQLSRYDLVVFEHGFRPGELEVFDLLTSMFLHGGWLHLLGNMLFLWIYGDNVEHRLGRMRYLLFYLGTGVVAALGDGLLRVGSDIPSVGASGAISGVLGAYFLWFPRNQVRLLVAFFPFLVQAIEVSARWVLGAYVLLDNLLPLLIAGGGGGISYGAHLGGFAGGVAAAWLLNRVVLERPEAPLRSGSWAAAQATAAGGNGVDAFREALAMGRADDAARLLFSMPRSVARARVSAEAKLALASLLERAGRGRAALNVYERVVRDHPDASERTDGLLGIARLMLETFDMPAEAYAFLRQADTLPMTRAQHLEKLRLVDKLREQARSVPRGFWN